MSKRVVTLQMLIDAGAPQRVIKQIEAEIDKLKTTASRTEKVASQTFKTMDQSAGLAGASIIAFSQGLTDVQYGMRGVANNISQLSILFSSLVSQSGGLKGAFRSIVTQLRGPLGVIVAINALLAVLQYWETKNQDVKKSNDELNESLGGAEGTISILQHLYNVASDVNLTMEQREGAMIRLKKLGLDVEQIDLNQAGALEKLNERLYLYNQLIVLRAKADHQANKIKTLSVKLLDLENEKLFDNLSGIEKFLIGNPKMMALFNSTERSINKNLEERTETQNELDEALADHQLLMLDVTSIEGAYSNATKKSTEIIRQNIDAITLQSKGFTQDQINREIAILEQQRFNEQMKDVLGERRMIETDYAEFRHDQQERDAKRTKEYWAFRLSIERTSLDLLTSATDLFWKTSDNQSKRQFEAQKRFNIATAIIDTYFAAQAAYKSQIIVPEPSAPIRAAIAAAAALASGLGRVNAIRKQQYNTSGLGTPSGSTATATIGGRPQAPNTGFTAITPFDPVPDDPKVYVLDKDIREVRLKNQTVQARAKVK